MRLANPPSPCKMSHMDQLNATSPPPYRWIVNPRYDVTFFMGSGVLTLIFWGFYEGLKAYGFAPSGLAILLTYGVFTSLLDLPHIFQTFSRTHADPVEFKRRRWLYTAGIPVLMAGGLLIPWLGLESYFIAFMALYGSHHIVRQHIGFVKIYQGLNEPYQAVDRLIDRLAMELCLYACIIHDYVGEMGQKTHVANVYGALNTTFPSVPPAFGEITSALAWLALAVLVGRQIYLALTGQRLNLPKLLLMAAALSTHFFIFVVAAVPFLVAEAIETAYHDVQYHGWIAHFQQRRFPQVMGVAGKWLKWSLLYGLLAGLIETLGYVNDVFYWIFAPLGMLTLFHYYIDGKIWKLRNCPELRELVFAAEEVLPIHSADEPIGL